VISGREFLPLACPDNLKITPGSSCVQIPGTKYTFSCDFQGEWLGINGREPLGAEKRVIHPTVTEGAQNEGWSHQDCVLEFPSPGVWRVLFGVGGQVGAIQTIVAGEMLAPTSEERIALAAPLVE
jgi:hypothetical protein